MKKILLIVLLAVLLSCSGGTESKSKYDPPVDHAVSKDGARHKPGLTTPLSNCVSCHGDDLKGGSVDVSCYECHGKKW